MVVAVLAILFALGPAGTQDKSKVTDIPILARHKAQIYFTPFELAKKILGAYSCVKEADPRLVAGFLVLDEEQSRLSWNNPSEVRSFGRGCPDTGRSKQVIPVPYATEPGQRTQLLLVETNGPPVDQGTLFRRIDPPDERIRVTLPFDRRRLISFNPVKHDLGGRKLTASAQIDEYGHVLLHAQLDGRAEEFRVATAEFDPWCEGNDDGTHVRLGEGGNVRFAGKFVRVGTTKQVEVPFRVTLNSTRATARKLQRK